jgi:hypothetical protein
MKEIICKTSLILILKILASEIFKSQFSLSRKYENLEKNFSLSR